MYLWLIPYINPLQNGWKKSDNTLFPHWFIGTQFPPSVTKKRYDGYEADDETKEKKRKYVISYPGRKLRKKTTTMAKCTENEHLGDIDENNDEMDCMVNSSTANENESDWGHFSEFSESLGSSDSDWM